MKILLIDDDSLGMRYYIDALSDPGGHDVEHIKDQIAGQSEIQKTDFPYALVILDLIIKPPIGSDISESAALIAGVTLFRRLRESQRKNLPMLILSNNTDIIDTSMMAADKNVRIFNKANTTPLELTEFVRRWAQEWR